jgi:TRAP-type C4-dicarboxylate transport system substrate-binding protein
MKRFLILAALAMTLMPSLANARRVTVKLATLAPKGTNFHKILSAMGDEWKTLSDGQVRVKIFPGGIAGDDEGVVRKMRLGTVGAAMLTAAGVSAIDKAVNAAALPMHYQSYEELEYVFEKMRPELEAVYAAKGFVVLGWANAGFVRFFTKTKAVTPAEMSALKLFVWAGKPEITALWKLAGFNVVPLPSTEISTALQTGLISALPTTPQAANLMSWYKHVGFMVDQFWAPLVGAIVIEKAVWAKIDPALQPKLLASARKAAKQIRASAKPTNHAAMKAMAANGLTIIKPTPAQRTEWEQRVEKVWPKIRGTFAPEHFFDLAVKHRTAFRALGSFTDGGEE